MNDPTLWRLQAARALAWALLLGGWVGLGSLAQTLTPGPLSAFSLLAAWLLALGTFAELIARAQLHHAVLRGLLLCAALLAARASLGLGQGGGAATLVPALLAWAIVVALASAAVRGCRIAARRRPGPPVGAAAAGAALAWLALGDPADLHALAPRLVWSALAACVVLAVLLPRRSGPASACRAGLFDCSLPAWASAAWREPRRWPLLLAALAMLPMMCSLPWMVSLCRSASVSPQAVVGLHFAAMFGPALLLRRGGLTLVAASRACTLLLALGALALWFAPGSSAWWGLALAHGAAWSVAWAAQLNDPGARGRAHASPLNGAALNALITLLLGVAVATAGWAALAGVHIALGVAAVAAAVVGPVLAARARRGWTGSPAATQR